MGIQIPSFKSFTESHEEYFAYAKRGEIFRIGLHLNTPMCNWQCPYCYAGAEFGANKSPMTPLSKIKDWILQAKDVGCKAVTINGEYETSLSKDLIPISEFCTNEGLLTTVVTNTSGLNLNKIRALNEMKISILMKLNVPIVDQSDSRFTEFSRIQSNLSFGRDDRPVVYKKLISTLELLISEGFNNPEIERGNIITRLGVESIITGRNVKHLPELIAQLRPLNIYTHMEVLKNQGNCGENKDITVGMSDLRNLFEEVLRNDIDAGYDSWFPKPPYIAGTCYQNLGRANININGDVTPCPGIHAIGGNLNVMPLRQILNHKIFQIVRHLEDHVTGKCKECIEFKNKRCYAGCRGTAFQDGVDQELSLEECLTGSDSLCWNNQI